MGALCRSYPGPRGQDMVDEEERTVRMTLGAYCALMRNAFGNEMACITEGDGKQDEEVNGNEEKRRAFIRELESGLVGEGALAVWTEIVARVG